MKPMLDPKRDMPKNPPKPSKPPIVEVPPTDYQPTAKELREDLRLKGTFEDAIKALVRPVRVRQVDAAPKSNA